MRSLLPALLLCGCGLGLMPLETKDAEGDSGGLDDPGFDSDADTDADSDADSDSDADADTDTDTDADTDADLESLTLSGLSPDYGLTTGGTTITITGGPFDTTARVWFGGQEGTVRSATEDTLTVESPAASGEGRVDLRVETLTHEGRMEDAFTYWLDASGQAVAIGVVGLAQQVGSYWSGSVEPATGSAAVYFTDPLSFSWWELYAPSLDSCRNESSYTYSGSIYVLDPGLASITLTPASGSAMTLSWDSEYGGYFNDSLTSSTFRASSSYRLDPMTGTAFPQVGVDAFVRTPAQPYVSTPAISGSSVPYLSRYQTFYWTSQGADWVRITMAVLDSSGTGYQEVVNCIARDDGSFSFDGSQLTSWPYLRQVDIYFGMAFESDAVLPWNNGQSRVVGLYEIYGAGFSN